LCREGRPGGGAGQPWGAHAAEGILLSTSESYL